MKKQFEPFYATVGDVLDISPLFFNASLASIVREVAQNARRAGATILEIDHENSSELRIRDNGGGCEPQDLMGFASSKWGESVRRTETPAGIGFWSLAKRGASVRCGRGWKVELLPGHFTGKLPITPEYCEPQVSLGLEITTKHPEGSRVPWSVAEYYPFKTVLINGDSAPTGKAFLDPAVKSYKVDGGHAQVFVEAYTRLADGFDAPGSVTVSASEPQIVCCYNGHVLTVYSSYLKFQEYGLTVGNAYQRSRVRMIKVDLKDEKCLPLTLPQRDSVQQGAEYEALLVRLHNIYEAELNRVFGKKNVWRTENDRWAGCIVSCADSVDQSAHGLGLKLRPITGEAYVKLVKRKVVLPCFDLDENRVMNNLLFDAMLCSKLKFFSLRENALNFNPCNTGWRAIATENLSTDVRITDSSGEFFIGVVGPSVGIKDLRVAVNTSMGSYEFPCKWFIPFHSLWGSFLQRGSIDEETLLAPSVLLSNKMTAAEHEKLDLLISGIENRARKNEANSGLFWESANSPYHCVADAIKQVLHNLKDPVAAFENSLKAAVSLVCSRLPETVWGFISSAVITVDSRRVGIELKK